ncbi:MAG TPA: site-2 protease family protein [Solirubrobacteraceae bacterium]|jgi:Zn-dependent protease|nr:site-2 protease family protein [Solirubrobacteraceae bacterium]
MRVLAMSQHWPTPSIPVPPRPAADVVEPDHAAPPDIAPEPPRPWWRRGLSWLVVAGAFLLKFGKAALLLLPKAKLLTTSGTMLVSLAAYSLIWGWKFALGFVLLLFVHEMGHVIQLRREGIPASAPMFIPFLGAVVTAKSLGDNATAEARVGLAGPVLGTLGALSLLPVAIATGQDFWYALVFTGLFLNLFNLLPVVPLDGGRAMAALSPWMWFVGLFGMVLVAFVYPNPIIFLILLFAIMETYRRWKARKEGGAEVATYYRVKPAHRLAILAVYLGLIVVCGVGMELTHIERSIPS